MSIVYRNQAIARIAYAFAQIDGKVDLAEVEAVVQFLQAHPQLFDTHDQTEIIEYLNDFRQRSPKIQEILPESRLKRIREYLFGMDREVMYQLTQAIAQSHDGVSQMEADFLEKIQPYLMPVADREELNTQSTLPEDKQ